MKSLFLISLASVLISSIYSLNAPGNYGRTTELKNNPFLKTVINYYDEIDGFPDVEVVNKPPNYKNEIVVDVIETANNYIKKYLPNLDLKYDFDHNVYRSSVGILTCVDYNQFYNGVDMYESTLRICVDPKTGLIYETYEILYTDFTAEDFEKRADEEKEEAAKVIETFTKNQFDGVIDLSKMNYEGTEKVTGKYVFNNIPYTGRSGLTIKKEYFPVNETFLIPTWILEFNYKYEYCKITLRDDDLSIYNERNFNFTPSDIEIYRPRDPSVPKGSPPNVTTKGVPNYGIPTTPSQTSVISTSSKVIENSSTTSKRPIVITLTTTLGTPAKNVITTTRPPKITTTTTTTTLGTTKVITSAKRLPYVTECTTQRKYVTVSTNLHNLPTKTLGKSNNIPVYTLLPKDYEACTARLENCKSSYISGYPLAVKYSSFRPIQCPKIELDDEVVAIADPNQKDIFIPETTYGSSLNQEEQDHYEYMVREKTLHCYKREYGTTTRGKLINTCITTLDPVEITTTNPVPTETTSVVITPVTAAETVLAEETTEAVPMEQVTEALPTEIEALPTETETETPVITSVSAPVIITTAKALPTTKTIGYTTVCSTKKKYVPVSTTLDTLPSKTLARNKNVPLYTVIPKDYEMCVKSTNVCLHITTYGDGVGELSTYIPVDCPEIPLDDRVVAIADPNQKDLFMPEGDFVLKYDLSKLSADRYEYMIYKKTLYCYKKHYEKTRGGFIRNDCVTTLDPVEITTKEETLPPKTISV